MYVEFLFKFFDKMLNNRELLTYIISEISKFGLFKNIVIICLFFLQAPVGVVLKDTIQEYLTPSAPAENAEGEQKSAAGSSTKEDEEGELF